MIQSQCYEIEPFIQKYAFEAYYVKGVVLGVGGKIVNRTYFMPLRAYTHCEFIYLRLS